MADIKAKLGVDGEASFKKAISEATGSVKEMKSALDLAKSAYQLTGDKAKYLEDKSKALKGEIEAQKGVIAALQGALNNAKTKYGENSSKVQAWQTKLNVANTALNNMQKELAETEAGLTGVSNKMDTATTDAGELSQGLDELNKKGDLSQLKSGLDTISSTLQSAARFAVQVGKALWGGTVESSEWADSLVTMSQQFGIDTKTLQQWTYASKLIDTEVDVILKARQKMIKGLTSTSEEVQGAWETLGISTTNPDGSFKDATELMWEALEALGQIENETERDNLAMTLFGKSAAELNPLIKAGRDAWEAMMREGQGIGAIVDDKDVERLAKFNDEWQRMNSVATAMKYKFFAALSPAMEKIADALTVASQKLSEFLESAEGQAAIGKLGDSIAKFVTNLVEKLPELLPTITSLVDALSGLLSFIAEHSSEITGVLGTLFVGSKVGSFGVGLMQAFNVLKGLFGGGGTPAGGGAQTVAQAGGAAAAKGGLWSWLGSTVLPAVAPWLGLGTVTAATGAALDKKATERVQSHYQYTGDVTSTMAGINAGTIDVSAEDAANAERLAEAYAAMAGANTDVDGVANLRDFLTGMSDADLSALHELAPDLEIWQEFADRGFEINAENAKALFEMSDEVWGLIDADTLQKLALNAMDVIGQLFQNGGFIQEAQEAGAQAGEAAAEGAEGASDMSGAGNNAGSTLVDSIVGWFAAAFNAGQGLGQSVANGVQAGLDIHSPSRVMQELGEYTTAGFALGIENGISDVENAVMSMTDATVGAASRTGGGGQQGMANMLANALRGVKVEIDGVTAGALLTPTVSEILGMQADSWRYDNV